MPSSNTQHDHENDDAYYDQEAEKQKVLRQRRFYPSRFGGCCINAVTGEPYYDIKQGSFEELRLYRVSDCSGFYDKKGFLRRNNDPINNDPNILYYDNPEQYGRHVKKKLPQCQINRWHTNIRRMFPDGGKFVKAEWEKFRKEKYNIILRGSHELLEDEWK